VLDSQLDYRSKESYLIYKLAQIMIVALEIRKTTTTRAQKLCDRLRGLDPRHISAK